MAFVLTLRNHEDCNCVVLVISHVFSDELSEFMEKQGADSPGVLALTTSLSTVGVFRYCLNLCTT